MYECLFSVNKAELSGMTYTISKLFKYSTFATQNAFNRHINLYIEKGYLYVDENNKNKTSKLVRMTDKGREMYVLLTKIFELDNQ
jgi:SOS-response transcriptional repressor LexA